MTYERLEEIKKLNRSTEHDIAGSILRRDCIEELTAKVLEMHGEILYWEKRQWEW